MSKIYLSFVCRRRCLSGVGLAGGGTVIFDADKIRTLPYTVIILRRNLYAKLHQNFCAELFENFECGKKALITTVQATRALSLAKYNCFPCYLYLTTDI